MPHAATSTGATRDANSSLWMPPSQLAGRGLAGWSSLSLKTLKQCHGNPQPTTTLNFKFIFAKWVRYPHGIVAKTVWDKGRAALTCKPDTLPVSNMKGSSNPWHFNLHFACVFYKWLPIPVFKYKRNFYMLNITIPTQHDLLMGDTIQKAWWQ